MSSLRTRLWLSYSLLILVMLCVLGVGLVLALQRSPLIFRATVSKLRAAESVAATRIEDLPLPLNPNATERLKNSLSTEAANRKLRIAILNPDGTPVIDVGQGTATPLPAFSTPLQTNEDDLSSALPFKDSKGTNWLYTLRQIDSQRYLLVATPLPNIPLRDLLGDEIFRPFIQAGLVALALAIIFSLAIGSWIARPIHEVAGAARQMAKGQPATIPPSGPAETRQLAEAFNEMAHRVQASQQSQRDFVANVSHELKTPLTSIQGFAQAILEGAAQTPEALKQAAGVIYSESGRMYRLVQDLLALARLEAGTADLQHTPVDLAALLKNVVEKFVPQAEKAQVRLVGDYPTLPVVIGDGDRLAQVFTNLVDNALKFTPPGGVVQVYAAAGEGTVTACVRDTGSGVAPEDQQRIFERFYQVDKSRKGGSGRGVGLGLPIAAQIVKAHGGQIWVESSPGQGSTFAVRLPVNSPEVKVLDTRRSAA